MISAYQLANQAADKQLSTLKRVVEKKMTARKTGKTFRAILKSLGSASNGSNVVHIVRNKNDMDRQLADMWRMATTYLSRGFVTVDTENHVLTFEHGVKVWVISARLYDRDRNKFRGIEYVTVTDGR